MTSRSEVLGNRTIRGEKPLRMAGRFEPLHAILALTRWPMGVLTPVIAVSVLPGQLKASLVPVFCLCSVVPLPAGFVVIAHRDALRYLPYLDGV
jgi:hypothetical protein